MTRFDEVGIANAAQSPGAYRLYRGGAVMFIGAALDLRSTLERHLRGGDGECTRAATGFECKPDNDPVGLQRQWLAQYARDNGGALPECNERRRNGDAQAKAR